MATYISTFSHMISNTIKSSRDMSDTNLPFLTMAVLHGFISCSICGKVLDEVSKKKVSMIQRKNTRFKRIKRLGKRRPVL
ncbi:dna-directed rna polymerase subunit b' [Gossypium australe]|uniref:Dna-directed rna polymerase subunit b n=1 Tax=Gossypium australe TaxID=47621 RepID=A0A5B6X8W8_9ROSI|nr:dna-directed rna polymerase subunit b' [Gossypium australe]